MAPRLPRERSAGSSSKLAVPGMRTRCLSEANLKTLSRRTLSASNLMALEQGNLQLTVRMLLLGVLVRWIPALIGNCSACSRVDVLTNSITNGHMDGLLLRGIGSHARCVVAAVGTGGRHAQSRPPPQLSQERRRSLADRLRPTLLILCSLR